MNEYILELIKANKQHSKQLTKSIKDEDLEDEHSILRANNYLQQLIQNMHDNKLLLRIYGKNNT